MGKITLCWMNSLHKYCAFILSGHINILSKHIFSPHLVDGFIHNIFFKGHLKVKELRNKIGAGSFLVFVFLPAPHWEREKIKQAATCNLSSRTQTTQPCTLLELDSSWIWSPKCATKPGIYQVTWGHKWLTSYVEFWCITHLLWASELPSQPYVILTSMDKMSMFWLKENAEHLWENEIAFIFTELGKGNILNRVE